VIAKPVVDPFDFVKITQAHIFLPNQALCLARLLDYRHLRFHDDVHLFPCVCRPKRNPLLDPGFIPGALDLETHMFCVSEPFHLYPAWRSHHLRFLPVSQMEQKSADPQMFTYGAILAAARDVRGSTLYLVHWHGYRLTEATFEPASSLGKASFEIKFLNNVFSRYEYAYLPGDLCKAGFNRWKCGPAQEQIVPTKSIFDLLHFCFYYKAPDVVFEKYADSIWGRHFQADATALALCMPASSSNSSSS